MEVNRSVLRKIKPLDIKPNQIAVIGAGDGRQLQNERAHKSQLATEGYVRKMAMDYGYELVRLHSKMDDRVGGHCLLQEMYQSREAFAKLPPWAKLMLIFDQWAFNFLTAEGTWGHFGPKAGMVVYEGKAPGNVGGLAWYGAAKMKKYARDVYPPYFMWSSEKFGKGDKHVRKWFVEWASTGNITTQPKPSWENFRPHEHNDYAHEIELGKDLARNYQQYRREWLRFGGPECMGMVHAGWGRRDMEGTGIQLNEIDQGYLAKRMEQVPREIAERHIDQLVTWGMNLKINDDDPRNSITTKAKVGSGRMIQSIAEIVDEKNADGAAIAYQPFMNEYGEDVPSSDCAEFALSSLQRPRIFHTKTGKEIRKGKPLNTTNEADVGILIATEYLQTTARFLGWESRMCIPVSHDVRHGQQVTTDKAFWVDDQPIKGGIDSFLVDLNLSGPMPVEGTQTGFNQAAQYAQVLKDAGRSRILSATGYSPYADVDARRHDYEYFPNNGICSKARSRAGENVYCRPVILEEEKYMFLGRGASIRLTPEMTDEIWSTISDNWPLTLEMFYGRPRDEFNLYHLANHVTTLQAPSAKEANRLMFAMASLAHENGFKVVLCGDYDIRNSVERRIKMGRPIIGPYI